MRYEYISAYKIFGLNPDPAKGDVEIYRSADQHVGVILTSNVNTHCYAVDRGRALGLFMLRGFKGQSAHDEFTIALEQEIRTIQEARAKDIGSSLILLISIAGEVDVTLNGPRRTVNDFTFGIDLIDKEVIKTSHRNIISAFVSSVSLSTEPPTDVRRLLDDLYLIGANGHHVYSVSFSLSAEAYGSHMITDEIIEAISSQARSLVNIGDLSRVTRLLLMTSDKKNDRLRSFLAGWSALEVFVNKVFPLYESEFLQRIIRADPPAETSRYIDRVKQVMEGKYRLLDKFTVIAACLGGQTSEADIDLFKELKDSRDDFFHKQEVAENALRTAEIRGLLTQYLRAHIAFPQS